MTNEERRYTLKNLTELYSPSEFEFAVLHMPTEMEDANGQVFEMYFNFLQSLYALRGDFMNIEETELAIRVAELIGQAQEFNYPTNMLESL
jgi:hypothetical protein